MRKIVMWLVFVLTSLNLHSQVINYINEISLDSTNYIKKVYIINDTAECIISTIDGKEKAKYHYNINTPEILNGIFELYNSNEQLYSKGCFNNNLKSGTWTYYNEFEGYIEEKVTYESDHKNGKSYIFYPNKKLKSMHYYVRDTLILSKCYDTLGIEIDCANFFKIEVIETPPQFPGGDIELINFLNHNLKYPFSALEKGLQGEVVVEFFIETDGSIKNPLVIKNNTKSKECENAAINLIFAMPRWEPAYKNGKPLGVSYKLPINFIIND